MNAYIYNADIYCEPCGKKIAASLAKPSYPKPYDTGDYPLEVSNGGGESDSPAHCGNCHAFLENPLTSDGFDYVRQAQGEVADQWKKFYLNN